MAKGKKSKLDKKSKIIIVLSIALVLSLAVTICTSIRKHHGSGYSKMIHSSMNTTDLDKSAIKLIHSNVEKTTEKTADGMIYSITTDNKEVLTSLHQVYLEDKIITTKTITHTNKGVDIKLSSSNPDAFTHKDYYKKGKRECFFLKIKSMFRK